MQVCDPSDLGPHKQDHVVLVALFKSVRSGPRTAIRPFFAYASRPVERSITRAQTAPSCPIPHLHGRLSFAAGVDGILKIVGGDRQRVRVSVKDVDEARPETDAHHRYGHPRRRGKQQEAENAARGAALAGSRPAPSSTALAAARSGLLSACRASGSSVPGSVFRRRPLRLWSPSSVAADPLSSGLPLNVAWLVLPGTCEPPMPPVCVTPAPRPSGASLGPRGLSGPRSRAGTA